MRFGIGCGLLLGCLHLNGEYGINPWNGIYYKLYLDEANGQLTGELHEVDLDILAAPSDAGVTYPIQAADLITVDPNTHAYPTLLIHQPE